MIAIDLSKWHSHFVVAKAMIGLITPLSPAVSNSVVELVQESLIDDLNRLFGRLKRMVSNLETEPPRLQGWHLVNACLHLDSRFSRTESESFDGSCHKKSNTIDFNHLNHLFIFKLAFSPVLIKLFRLENFRTLHGESSWAAQRSSLNPTAL